MLAEKLIYLQLLEEDADAEEQGNTSNDAPPAIPLDENSSVKPKKKKRRKKKPKQRTDLTDASEEFVSIYLI